MTTTHDPPALPDPAAFLANATPSELEEIRAASLAAEASRRNLSELESKRQRLASLRRDLEAKIAAKKGELERASSTHAEHDRIERMLAGEVVGSESSPVAIEQEIAILQRDRDVAHDRLVEMAREADMATIAAARDVRARVASAITAPIVRQLHERIAPVLGELAPQLVAAVQGGPRLPEGLRLNLGELLLVLDQWTPGGLALRTQVDVHEGWRHAVSLAAMSSREAGKAA